MISIDILIEAGKYLIGVFSDKKVAKKDKRLRLSSTLKTIGDLLTATAADLRNNIYPHGSCTAMDTLSKGLVDEMGDLLTPEQAESLRANLEMSSKLEELYAKREDTEFLNKIEQAAGHFYAVSILTSI